MSASSSGRRKILMWLGGAAAISAAAGAAALLPQAQPRPREEAGGLVVPDFAERASQVRLVMVTAVDEFYHLVLDPDGWVLTEKGRYPARPQSMAALLRAVSTMRYDRPMTRDPRKFDSLGLGDPTEGGTGALLEIGNGRGDNFAKLLVGHRPGGTYVRHPHDLQAWAVTGEAMPPLHRGARWLDLGIVDIPAARIREVEVRPAGGPAYRLLAENGGARFALAPPHSMRRPLTPLSLAFAGGVASRFSPVDVTLASDVAPSAISADHVTRTHDGLEVRLRAWRHGVRGWVAVNAVAMAGASAGVREEAEALQERAEGWAFAMTENDWAAITAPLSELVEG